MSEPHVYYNDNDAVCAQWIRELGKRGSLPAGVVDERSIRAIPAADVLGFRQCHWFAGIGGWPYALQLARWPESLRVWTGSCPCQPFSLAGDRQGFKDPRHLWPAWWSLIRECRPAVVIGEQVATALDWLDAVFSDLEGAGYSCGATDLCAAGVGAPHIRQRLYFVAYDLSARLEIQREQQTWRERAASERSGQAHGLGDASGAGSWRNPRAVPAEETGVGLANWREHHITEHASEVRGMVNTGGQRCVEHSKLDCTTCRRKERARWVDTGGSGHWRRADWIRCADGQRRPVEPGTFPLAYGVPGRVGRLRGYGNAIVPQVAQAFAEAFLECAL